MLHGAGVNASGAAVEGTAIDLAGYFPLQQDNDLKQTVWQEQAVADILFIMSQPTQSLDFSCCENRPTVKGLWDWQKWIQSKV